MKANQYFLYFLFLDPFYIPALLFSFSLIVTGIHRYNERQTSALMSVLVSIPFTVISVLVRLLALSIIIVFCPQSETMLLLLSILCSIFLSNTVQHFKKDCIRPCAHENEGCKLSAFLHCLPRLVLRSVADILMPLGYNSDIQLGQRSLRGSWLILSNYVIVMVGLGISLGLTILHHVPNTYDGIDIANSGVKLEIPDTDLILRTASGINIKVKENIKKVCQYLFQVKVPGSQLDFANSPHLETSFTLDYETHVLTSIVAPIVLVLLTLPNTITRVAMMGMDCVVIRPHNLNDKKEQQMSKQRTRNSVPFRLGASLIFGSLGVLLTAAVISACTFLFCARLIL